MRQLDLCSISPGRDVALVVVLQHDWLDTHRTVVVAPAILAERHKPVERIHPRFEHDGNTYIVALNLMSAVSRQEVRQSVASLEQHRDAIMRGIDMLFSGF